MAQPPYLNRSIYRSETTAHHLFCILPFGQGTATLLVIAKAQPLFGLVIVKLAIIIPTLGRGEQVARLLSHLEHQTRLPDEVIVAAPDPSHVVLPATTSFPVVCVFGKQGSCAQRNSALDHAQTRFDFLIFLDDDFVPAHNYIEGVLAAFEAHHDWTVVMGWVVRDGARTEGVTWEDALAALEASANVAPKLQAVDHVGAYGCNMSVRAHAIGNLRFDERLVLYGWQEDIDFTSQLRSHGRIVGIDSIRGVHLGIKSGRVSGRRFGYSQIANPIYLVRKGTVPLAFALPLMARNLLANTFRSVHPEPWIDRRGRLRGNMLALFHFFTGQVDPGHVLRL